MPLLHLFLVLLTICIWGVNFVVIKVGLGEMPPLFLCFARFFVTSIPAVFFIKKPATSFGMIALYGFVMYALQFALLFFAISAGISPGLASILLQLQALFSVLLAASLLGEKIHIWTVVGAAISFSGIGLVGMNLGGDITLTGLILVILAAVIWSSGSVIVKKLGGINMFALVIWGGMIAWPILLAASLLIEGSDQVLHLVQNISWISIGAVFYIAYLATIFGFGVWNWLLQRHPISKLAPFTLLTPVVGMVSSSLYLGEPLQSWKILAGLLVVGGLCINLAGPRVFEAWRRRREKNTVGV